jgi:hypothetical protein
MRRSRNKKEKQQAGEGTAGGNGRRATRPQTRFGDYDDEMTS